MIERQSNVVAWTKANGQGVLIPCGNRMQILLFLFNTINNKFQLLRLWEPYVEAESHTTFLIEKINNLTFQSISCLSCLKLPRWKNKWGLCSYFWGGSFSMFCQCSLSTEYVLIQIWMKERMNGAFLWSLSLNHKEIITFPTVFVYRFNKHATLLTYPHSVLAYIECTCIF